ncbi:PepSY domain-containing protein [Telmatospirillum sp. J64-1]|uniref:PepSY domain-containing protein n=1 Tax=Telmatospirillum sp. J64-1 TaxID=2502183 RepID=UPI00115DD159|nr:PepSY domain-containing protein [Telmatospirillum sp. J64-1]
MSKSPLGFALILSLAFAPVATKAEDRPPTPEERAQIEEVLKTEGYTRWDSIELDDSGVWEVQDAIAADGQEYDLILDQQFRIIRQDPD